MLCHHGHNTATTTDPALFQACRWLGRCITAHSFSHGLTRLVCAPGFPRCARLLRVAGGGGSRERQGETLKAAEGVGGSRQRDTRSHWHPPSQGTSARGVLRAAPHMTDPPPARFSSSFSLFTERASEREARAGDAPLRAPSLFLLSRRKEEEGAHQHVHHQHHPTLFDLKSDKVTR